MNQVVTEYEGLGRLFRRSADAPIEAFCFPMEPEDLDAVAAEERAWESRRIGDIYSLPDADGRFVLVEVVSASYRAGILFAVCFADRFDERPTRVDPRTLTRAEDRSRVELWCDIYGPISENEYVVQRVQTFEDHQGRLWAE